MTHIQTLEKKIERLQTHYDERLGVLDSHIEALEAQMVYLQTRDEETFPEEVVSALIKGTSPLRVFRKYRKLSQQGLAEISGVSRNMIAQIETGKKNGSLASIKKLTEALNLELDDLI